MKKTILVVDDNEGDRKLIEEALFDAQLDVRMIEAKTGDEGLELAKNEKPDLILMDILMPGISGGDAVKFLQEDKRTSHIPVIFLTGVYSKEDEQMVEKINIEEVYYDSIAKPFDDKKLISVINKYVQ